MKAFVERTGADELMLTSQIYDHSARLRSYEIAAGLLSEPQPSIFEKELSHESL